MRFQAVAALLLPALGRVHAAIEGTLTCEVYRAPLEVDTEAKKAAIRAVADAAIDRLCHANRTDCAGPQDTVHNYCWTDEKSTDGTVSLTIDVSTRNGLRQDEISVDDCLELFGKVRQGCVEEKWQQGSFQDVSGSRQISFVYEQLCEAPPLGLCG